MAYSPTHLYFVLFSETAESSQQWKKTLKKVLLKIAVTLL